MSKPKHVFVDEHDCLQDATKHAQRHRWHFYSRTERERAETALCRRFAVADLDGLKRKTGLIVFYERKGGMYTLCMEWMGIHGDVVCNNAMDAKQVIRMGY